MKQIILLVTIFFSVSVNADNWRIGDTLEVNPDNVDVTLQIFEDFHPTEKLVHGWKGKELNYLLLVDKQPGGEEESYYWVGMLNEIRSGADKKEYKVLSEGAYLGDANNKISFKVVSWVSEGELYIQMMNLLVGNKDTYWVFGLPFTEDLHTMTVQTKKLLSSSRIIEK